MLKAINGAFNRKAFHCDEIRKMTVKKPCAIFSGRINYRKHCDKASATVQISQMSRYLVELVAKVYWIDVVAFKIGEHDNLIELPFRRV